MHTKKNNNGFTLYETLFAVVIVALSGLIIAGALSVAVRDYESVLKKNEIQMLLDEYLDSIKIVLEDARIVEGNNETKVNPVFESDNYGCAGSYVVAEGIIVFRAATIDESGSICFKNDLRQIVPKRNHRVGVFSNDDVEMGLSYVYEDCKFIGKITATSGDVKIEKEFSYILKSYLVNNGVADEE